MLTSLIRSHWKSDKKQAHFHWWRHIKRNFGGDKFPGGNEGLGERLSLEVKGERWDLIPREESKFDDGRRKTVVFTCLQ